MPLIVKFGTAFWRKSIDLLRITKEEYRTLDTQPKTVREKIVKSMLKKFKHEDMLAAIERLSRICFDVKGAPFIRTGSSSFLADILKTYVDQYDGEQFGQAYTDGGLQGLRHFKFSQQSTDVFQLLWRLANDRAAANPEYITFLPINISNKIWQPIILDRAAQSSLMALSCDMQALAHDSELINAILMSNVGIAQADDTVGAHQPRGRPAADRFFGDPAERRGDVVVLEQTSGNAEPQYPSHGTDV